MIIVADTATFKAPVTLLLPNKDGQLVDQTGTFTFNFYTKEEFQDLNKQLAEKKLKDDDLLIKVISGWGADIVDQEQKPIPFSEANLKKILSVHGMSVAMIHAYFNHVNAASEKNLKALLSPAAAAE